MTRHELRPGTIVQYPYLWKWQRDRGEDAGRKDCPVCVVIAARAPTDGNTHVALLAISSSPPSVDQTALEVPEVERRRGGLSDLKQAWVTISEFNYDVVERSFHLDINEPIRGRFSKPFMMRLAQAFLPVFKARGARVDRAE
jgi:hypothetical protein